MGAIVDKNIDIYHLLDEYGVTPSGFARFALLATDPDTPLARKADALYAMGHIARYFELDLSIDETGLPFFLQARKYDPTNIRACREILTLYQEPPDGHADRDLASECLAVLDAAESIMSPDDRHYLQEGIRIMKERGIDVASLRMDRH